jgi:glycosyltransferase involved in cell wall biosynthesis
MKIIACAYACNPFHGSEEGVGWGWVNAIANPHEVWVLTAAYHRSDLEKALCRDPKKYGWLHFVYVDEKPWHYRPTRAWIQIENSIAKPIMNWAYRSWMRDAFSVARNLHREVGFDLVHQLTYVGFRFPGHLWKLGIPFVWGPIGGMENVPWRLLPSMGTSGMGQFACRNLVNSLHKRALRKPKVAFRAARGGIIAATTSIQREIKRHYGEDSAVISEVGLPPMVALSHSQRASNEPLRLCWSGVHLQRKGLPLLLSALASAPQRLEWTLDILGSGTCTRQWRERADQLGVAANCRWLGQLSRDEAVQRMRECHVFVITSLQDLTSTVLAEALAQGLPVLCPDHCGFVDAINESCGFRLPIGTPHQFIMGLGEVIKHLHDNEELRRRLAAGAIVRARIFSWEQKAAALECIYRRVIEARGRNSTDVVDARAAKSL